MLRLVREFLTDNDGNTMPANGMAGVFSQTMNVTDKTVAAYVKALNAAYAFYHAKCFGLHGMAVLRTLLKLPKQHIVDTGMCSFLMGYRGPDVGCVFENAVYIRLLYDGWSVHVCKLNQKEIDSICLSEGEVLYAQTAESMIDEATCDWELAPLCSIVDNHSKWVVVR